MKQITVITENRIDNLADICETLGSANINIEFISAQGLAEAVVVRIIVNDEANAVKVLEKRGFKVLKSEIITINVKNRPGELARIARKLAQKKVGVHYIYLASESPRSGQIIIKPDNFERALRALKDEDYVV
ncbi:hypothetical protein BEH94_05000 [Candidatus Altiarchaeales archaeon WOR_SM1_SCG]|nr:hypothetical protein BEH94_05000 [Candidatus Altiarchaeales archaeon WOR_SM1_SCG]